MKRCGQFLCLVFCLLVLICVFVSCDFSEMFETQETTPNETIKKDQTDTDKEEEKTTETHEHRFGEWETVKAPTCSEDGLQMKRCVDCSVAETNVLSAVGHSETVIPAKAANCTEKGLTEGKQCSACGEIFVAQDEIPALGHREEVIPPVAATCTQSGLTEGTKCSACGEILVAQDLIPEKGHRYSFWIETKAPTLTEAGEWQRACLDCGDVDVKIIPKLEACSHVEKTLSGVSATCTTKGKTEGKQCALCNEILVPQVEIPALGHDKINHIAKAPTCKEIGWDAYETCSRCEYTTYVEKGTIEHNYVDRICTMCNGVYYSQGLEFSANGDGTYSVSGIGNCTDTVIYIPPMTPDGKRVTRIGDFALWYCNSSSIVIPNTVKSIGKQAFFYCSNLTSVTIPNSVTVIEKFAFARSGITSIVIPNSVTSIGEQAFNLCNNLTSITLPFVGETKDAKENHSFKYIFVGTSGSTWNIPSTLKTVVITGGTRIEDSAFFDCNKIESITLPNGIIAIGARAFDACSSLKTIVIGNAVKSIGDRAFFECSSLENITFPYGLTSVGQSAFYGCSSLTSVSLPDSVTSIGENVFSKCIGLSRVTLSKGLKTMGRDAFWGCSSLLSITIPDGLETIEINAFCECVALKNITISNAVKKIDFYAFYYCNNLTDIYFLGTETEWNAIEKETAMIPNGVSIHYNYIPSNS